MVPRRGVPRAGSVSHLILKVENKDGNSLVIHDGLNPFAGGGGGHCIVVMVWNPVCKVNDVNDVQYLYLWSMMLSWLNAKLYAKAKCLFKLHNRAINPATWLSTIRYELCVITRIYLAACFNRRGLVGTIRFFDRQRAVTSYWTRVQFRRSTLRLPAAAGWYS